MSFGQQAAAPSCLSCVRDFSLFAWRMVMQPEHVHTPSPSMWREASLTSAFCCGWGLQMLVRAYAVLHRAGKGPNSVCVAELGAGA